MCSSVMVVVPVIAVVPVGFDAIQYLTELVLRPSVDQVISAFDVPIFVAITLEIPGPVVGVGVAPADCTRLKALSIPSPQLLFGKVPV